MKPFSNIFSLKIIPCTYLFLHSREHEILRIAYKRKLKATEKIPGLNPDRDLFGSVTVNCYFFKSCKFIHPQACHAYFAKDHCSSPIIAFSSAC